MADPDDFTPWCLDDFTPAHRESVRERLAENAQTLDGVSLGEISWEEVGEEIHVRVGYEFDDGWGVTTGVGMSTRPANPGPDYSVEWVVTALAGEASRLLKEKDKRKRERTENA